jgi:hypothetical protein
VAWIVVTYAAPRRSAIRAAAGATSQSGAVDDVDRFGDRLRGAGHAVVQLDDPRQERIEVARRRRRRHAVHPHAGAHLVRRVAGAAAREHVDCLAPGGEALGEPAGVAGEAALDERRVLPRDDQEAAAHGGGRPYPPGRISGRAAEQNKPAAMPDTFATLEREPTGVMVGLWVRRGILTVLGVLVLLALLNRYGQRPATSVARSRAATMRLSAPQRIRGGLFFQSRLDIRATQAIDHPRIVLEDGWLEGMQVNSIEPAPVGEATRDGRVVLSYDALKPGDVLRVWFQFEVNPTNVGRRSYAVELDDAEQPIVRLGPTITALP